MRLFKCKGIGLFFGGGLSVASAIVGCNDDKFDGCEATKTCVPVASAGSSHAAGEGGAKDDDEPSPKGGKSGSGGSAGSSAGASAGKSAAGGKGGSGGTGTKDDDDSSKGGAADGKDEPDDKGSGGRVEHAGDMGGAAGAEVEPEPDPDPDPEPDVDTTPPNIMMVDPSNGAVAVTANTRIVVDFDEPMDEASTEAAFQSSDATLANGHLFWKNGSRQLIVEPKDPLEYAEVTDPSGDAKDYVFTIAGSATDLAGNPLGIDRTFSFTTLRHVTQALGIPKGEGREVQYDQTDPTSRCDNDDDRLVVGDFTDDTGAEALLSFDIASLPIDITELKSVRLRAVLEETARSPYGSKRLGALHYLSVSTELDDRYWDKPGQIDLGEFAAHGNVEVSHSVLTAFTTDYENRVAHNERSQYLLRFDLRTDGDAIATNVEMRCGDVKLELEYLTP
jgi:hypothetical protein